VLRLRLDDITDPTLAEDRREVLTGVVVDQIDRIDGVADELAQLDPGRWELRTDPVDLAAICAAAVRRHAPLARWGGVGILFQPPSGSCAITGDRTVLDDAVGNVVQNAVKYTPRGGRISVNIMSDEEWVTVTVSDTGPGIGPGERDLVLRPGVRGSAGRRAEGSGHGLALVADAVHRHGGQVELADTLGGGTTVHLLFPLPD
jgi:signal transduction histidine kinase